MQMSSGIEVVYNVRFRITLTADLSHFFLSFFLSWFTQTYTKVVTISLKKSIIWQQRNDTINMQMLCKCMRLQSTTIERDGGKERIGNKNRYWKAREYCDILHFTCGECSVHIIVRPFFFHSMYNRWRHRPGIIDFRLFRKY